MREVPISTGRQLGAAIHDARVRARLTQAILAERAGVSRKWLIGLEQGARTGAELGKVLAVLRTLDLSIHLVEQHDAAVSEPSDTATSPAPTRGISPTSETRNALAVMRQSAMSSREVLDAMRQAAQLSNGAREAADQNREEE